MYVTFINFRHLFWRLLSVHAPFAIRETRKPHAFGEISDFRKKSIANVERRTSSEEIEAGAAEENVVELSGNSNAALQANFPLIKPIHLGQGTSGRIFGAEGGERSPTARGSAPQQETPKSPLLSHPTTPWIAHPPPTKNKCGAP
jgi:hypothetical protein